MPSIFQDQKEIKNKTQADFCNAARDIIGKKGSGVQFIGDGFFLFSEPWEYVCVYSQLEEDEIPDDDEEFMYVAQDVIDENEQNEIPNELKEDGFEIVRLEHCDYNDVPFGWTVAVVKKRNKKRSEHMGWEERGPVSPATRHRQGSKW